MKKKDDNLDPGIEEDNWELTLTGDPYKDLIMWQLKQVCRSSNVEFRGGFYITVSDKTGNDREIYIQDTREVFCNAIHLFAILTQNNFKPAEEKAFLKFKEDLKAIEDEFMQKSSVDEDIILGEPFYENPRDKILLEMFKNKKVKVHRNLLVSIISTVSKKNSFANNGGVIFR